MCCVEKCSSNGYGLVKYAVRMVATEVHTPNHFAAALLTIGVSSDPRDVNPFRSSSWTAGDTLEYTAEYSAADDVREVNHSPVDRRLTNGT